MKVVYNDQQADGKTSVHGVLPCSACGPRENDAPSFDTALQVSTPTCLRTRPWAPLVGYPGEMTASDPNDGDILSYVLSGERLDDDDDFFNIDIATGQADHGCYAKAYDHERC